MVFLSPPLQSFLALTPVGLIGIIEEPDKEQGLRYLSSLQTEESNRSQENRENPESSLIMCQFQPVGKLHAERGQGGNPICFTQ